MVMNKQILSMLDFTESQLNNYLFDFGCNYAEHYLGKEHADMFISNPEYWIWFTNQFNNSNNEFIANCSVSASLMQLRNQWLTIHQPKFMKVYPSSVIVKQASGKLRGMKKGVHNG